jgi:hypothetical protein
MPGKRLPSTNISILLLSSRHYKLSNIQFPMEHSPLPTSVCASYYFEGNCKRVGVARRDFQKMSWYEKERTVTLVARLTNLSRSLSISAVPCAVSFWSIGYRTEGSYQDLR